MRKHYALIFSALCSLILTGCLRNSTSTVALPEIIIVEDVPDDVIPAAIRDEFESHMTVYEGKLPPVIEGQYLLKDYLLKYTSDGQYEVGHQFADRYIAFLGQIAGQCRFAGKQAKTVGKADKVYISGIGNDFTAYYVAENNGEDGSQSTMSTLVSGTITNAGIRNCQYAFIMIDKYDPNEKMMAVNDYRIFYDADGLAERYEWYDTEAEAPARIPANANSANQNNLLETIKLNLQKH